MNDKFSFVFSLKLDITNSVIMCTIGYRCPFPLKVQVRKLSATCRGACQSIGETVLASFVSLHQHKIDVKYSNQNLFQSSFALQLSEDKACFCLFKCDKIDDNVCNYDVLLLDRCNCCCWQNLVYSYATKNLHKKRSFLCVFFKYYYALS